MLATTAARIPLLRQRELLIMWCGLNDLRIPQIQQRISTPVLDPLKCMRVGVVSGGDGRWRGAGRLCNAVRSFLEIVLQGFEPCDLIEGNSPHRNGPRFAAFAHGRRRCQGVPRLLGYWRGVRRARRRLADLGQPLPRSGLLADGDAVEDLIFSIAKLWLGATPSYKVTRYWRISSNAASLPTAVPDWPT